MKTKELFFFFFCFLFFFFFFFLLFFILFYQLEMVESACTSCWYTWHRGMDEICFYSYFFLFFSKWMDYTITPTSSLFPVPIIVPEWDLTCSTSPSYRLVSGFIQLYLYWLLAVIYSQGVLSHVDCTWTTSPQTVPWWPSLCQMVLLFVVSVGCDQISHPQPLTVASILLLRIKTPLRPFWIKHNHLLVVLGHCRSYKCSSFFRFNCLIWYPQPEPLG